MEITYGTRESTRRLPVRCPGASAIGDHVDGFRASNKCCHIRKILMFLTNEMGASFSIRE